ncbi:MAG: discoidin domain-containing protein, partial [Planctomycetes bacterium]|nr:discoidin domain-containing protein [Planctomycetota bacterium]
MPSNRTKSRLWIPLQEACFLLLLGLGLVATAAEKEDIVLYLPFEDAQNPIDASDDPATVSVRGSLNLVDGQFGSKGLEFNGNNANLVEVADADKLEGMTAITIEGWVRPRGMALQDGMSLASKRIGTNNQDSYNLFVWNGNIVNGRINGSGGTAVLSTTALVDETWYHLAMVFDGASGGDKLQLYVNGVLEGSVGHAATSVNPGDASLWIGELDAIRGFSWNGALDEVGIWNVALSEEEINDIMVRGKAKLFRGSVAWNPVPSDGAEDVPYTTGLSWAPGEFAATRDVYFGTQFDDVNDAGRADPAGALASEGQTETTFDPSRLAFGETYYWRVDEVNGTPDFTIHRGDIWSFTTEPFSIPITNITATASSSFGASEPEKTIDGSGLVDDLHGTSAGNMWISAGIPATLEYAFDRAYKLHELWIWNSNQVIEAFVGFGVKDVVIEHSLDGENWTVLDGVGPLAQATGTEGYAHNNTIDFGGATAQYVRLTVNSVQGIAPQASLSEVRFYSIPTFATRPNPETGATDVVPNVTLAWGRDGREADHHDIYVGSNPDDLTLAGTVSESGFDTLALDLELGQSYHWRVDEVNEAMDPSHWASDIWSFTTVDSISIDDMESYADAEFFEIWATWVDGFDDPTNGSLVGGVAGIPETDLVHGGGQSLPMDYDNSAAAQSEATRTFDAPMDWTGHGIQGLVLYFQGSASNTGGSLYVKINGTKVAYDGDPANLMRGGWSKWYIPLADVAGNLGRVTSLTIGIDGGGEGVVYLDDIFLTSDTREFITPIDPGSAGLLVHWAFDEAAGDTAGDTSGNNHAGTINGATWTAGGFDGSGYSLAFGGDGDFVVDSGTVMSQINGLSAVTVAVWVNSDVTNTDHGFIHFIDPDGGDDGGMRYDAAGASFSGTNVMKMSLHTTGGNVQLESSSGAQTTEWQHVAMSWQSGESLKLYINGILDTPTGATDPTVGTVDTVTQLLVGRGAKDDLVSESWEGLIDGVRVYNRGLTDGEVAGL